MKSSSTMPAHEQVAVFRGGAQGKHLSRGIRRSRYRYKPTDPYRAPTLQRLSTGPLEHRQEDRESGKIS